MAEKHSYDVTIDGDTYTVDSDHELTDVEAYNYAKSQVPFDVNKQNAIMRSNMAKQPTEAEMQARAASEPWTASAMKDRAIAGAKGEAEGLAAGIAAPAVLAYHVIRHPVDTADAVAKGAVAATALGANAITHPIDTGRAAADFATQVGSDPENIGRIAGGVEAGLVLPPALRFAKSTRAGQAVAAGVSDAVNSVPGVRAARAILKPAPAAAPKVSAAAARAAAETERLANSGVTSVADAAASNPEAAMNATRTPVQGLETNGQSMARMMRERLGLEEPIPGEDAAVAQPLRGATPEPSPVNTGERLVDQPLHAQQAAMENGEVITGKPSVEPPADAGRVSTPTHLQEGNMPGRGHESVTRLGEGEGPGSVATNASGESEASQEAINRARSLREGGDTRVVQKGGTERPLGDATTSHDYEPKAGETVGVRKADGSFVVEKTGTGARPNLAPKPVGAGTKAATFEDLAKELARRIKDGTPKQTAVDEMTETLQGQRGRRMSASDLGDARRMILERARALLGEK